MNLRGKQLNARLRKCGKIDRYKIRLYHKGPRMAELQTRRKYPFLFEAGPFTLDEWSSLKAKVKKGATFSYSMSKQIAQPLPQTIDVEAWGREFDAMALCELFGVPYEVYQESQTNIK